MTASIHTVILAAGQPAHAGPPAHVADLPRSWSEIPGNVTGLAPAATAFQGAVHTFVTGLDGHVYQQVFDLAGGGWQADWVQVPGGGVLTAAPAAASSADTLYVLGRGQDNQVWFNYREVGGDPPPDPGNPSRWSGWLRLPAGEATGPVAAVAANNGSVHVFRAAPDGGIYHSTMTIRYVIGGRVRQWGPWRSVSYPGGPPPYNVPAAAYDPGSNTVYLITGDWSNGATGLKVRALRNGTWDNDWCYISHPDVRTTAPAAAAVDGRGHLYLFRTDPDHRIRAQIYSGCGAIGGSFTVRGDGRTDAAPAVAAVNQGAQMLMLVKGEGGQSIWAEAFDPVGDLVSEVTTRGHFNEGNGALLPGHNGYDYAVAGWIPGAPMGVDCPSDLAIMVHGWTNPPAQGQDRFQRARESLAYHGFPRAQMIGFSWDSNTGDWGNTVGFDTGKVIANRAARKLAAFIDDYKNICGSTRVHLIGHSLGTRVVLEAIVALATDGFYLWNGPLAGAVVDDVHLLGAAVDNERAQTNDAYGGAIQAETGVLYNYYSSEDDILEFAYPPEEGDWALGEDGIEDPRYAPANYVEYDVRYELAGGGDDHYGYSGYLYPDGSLLSDGVMDWVRPRFT